MEKHTTERRLAIIGRTAASNHGTPRAGARARRGCRRPLRAKQSQHVVRRCFAARLAEEKLMRLPARFLSYGLCVLLATAGSAPFVAVLSAQSLWFESYRDGLTAWRSQDWDRAETNLKDALAKHPEQGRNVPVPGSRIIYLPEDYLGLVYVKQKRFQEALTLLQKVQQSRTYRGTPSRVPGASERVR